MQINVKEKLLSANQFGMIISCIIKAFYIRLFSITVQTFPTLNPPNSRSLKLHVKYFENGDRYDDGVNGSRIEKHPLVSIGT